MAERDQTIQWRDAGAKWSGEHTSLKRSFPRVQASGPVRLRLRRHPEAKIHEVIDLIGVEVLPILRHELA